MEQEQLEDLRLMLNSKAAKRVAVTILDDDGEVIELTIVEIRFEGGCIYLDAH